MPAFQYQLRGSDLSDLTSPTRDLIELRDSDLELGMQLAMPIGTMVRWHSGVTVPDGWLSADGSSKDKTTYLALFNVIGYTYGGSGANFTLPTVTDFIIRY